MPAHKSKGTKMHLTVIVLLYVALSSQALNLNDLLERVSMTSDRLHSLSTSLTSDIGSHLHPMARVLRPSQCHTAGLQTPTDKEQALKVPEAELLSLARSLLQAWYAPLSVLSNEAISLVHPEKSLISSKTQELRAHTNSLGDGLEHLVNKIPQSESIITLPFDGELGNDKNARLTNFFFLLSCFRRDSHKIDSFLKVLRCRAAKRPEIC